MRLNVIWGLKDILIKAMVEQNPNSKYDSENLDPIIFGLIIMLVH